LAKKVERGKVRSPIPYVEKPKKTRGKGGKGKKRINPASTSPLCARNEGEERRTSAAIQLSPHSPRRRREPLTLAPYTWGKDLYLTLGEEYISGEKEKKKEALTSLVYGEEKKKKKMLLFLLFNPRRQLEKKRLKEGEERGRDLYPSSEKEDKGEKVNTFLMVWSVRNREREGRRRRRGGGVSSAPFPCVEGKKGRGVLRPVSYFSCKRAQGLQEEGAMGGRKGREGGKAAPDPADRLQRDTPEGG